MPEGHTVHRIANEFNLLFGGKVLRVDSPQGRFTDSRLINGHTLINASAVGKQMFLNFGDDLILRIHLGIYGKWQFHRGAVPEVIGQVRARFAVEGVVAELRGPTVCEVIDSEALAVVYDRLGPDPLNPDPDGAEFKRFASRVKRSATSIGLLLMNQEVISGIGNVYRAEILFRAKINPHTHGKDLKPKQLKAIWEDSVMLLNVGVVHGVMITRDEFLESDPGKADRNWVYKREGQSCRRCKKKVVLEVAAGRKLYWCPGCQR
ncbi:MAG: Fpg/Nei family DNA glycosylase [Rhodoluna sp.]|jgi:formamidopyrimidine-DNA glycosylase|nr:Fpg/Nei family DNA glycosylase [Rhodoluna sp.]